MKRFVLSSDLNASMRSVLVSCTCVCRLAAEPEKMCPGGRRPRLPAAGAMVERIDGVKMRAMPHRRHCRGHAAAGGRFVQVAVHARDDAEAASGASRCAAISKTTRSSRRGSIPRTTRKSWAHWQVVQIEDQSQAWRWKDFRPTSISDADRAAAGQWKLGRSAYDCLCPSRLSQAGRARRGDSQGDSALCGEGISAANGLGIASGGSQRANVAGGDLQQARGTEQGGGWTPPVTPPRRCRRCPTAAELSELPGIRCRYPPAAAGRWLAARSALVEPVRRRGDGQHPAAGDSRPGKSIAASPSGGHSAARR